MIFKRRRVENTLMINVPDFGEPLSPDAPNNIDIGVLSCEPTNNNSPVYKLDKSGDIKLRGTK